MNPQFKKGVLNMCVLALLQQKEMYGYEIVQALSKEIDVAEGSVYPLLRRLTNDGLFTTYLQESTEGPPRKYYKITEEGIAQYNAMKQDWQQFISGVNSIMQGSEKK